jgi:hypothetical protein
LAIFIKIEINFGFFSIFHCWMYNF